MELKGRHYKIGDSVNCKIEIQDGLIGVYPVNPKESYKINKPLSEGQWNFRKVNWKESKPIDQTKEKTKGGNFVGKYSHIIEYLTRDNDTQRIFVKPTQWEIFNIKLNNGSLFWQQMTLHESIVAGLIVLLLQTIGSFIYNEFIRSDKKCPNLENKSIINQNLQQDSTTRTLIIPSILDSLKRHQNDSLIQR